MIEISILRNQPEEIIAKLKTKLIHDAEEIVSQILAKDEERRAVIQEVEGWKREMNIIAKSIGKLMKAGNKEEAENAKEQTSALKINIKSHEKQLLNIEETLQQLLVRLPNIPHETVPVGSSADDNQIIDQNDITIKFDFKALPHWEIALNKGMIDWNLGSKVTGSGFPIYIGDGARLQRALINFFLDQAIQEGYTEVIPPLMVNAASAYATGQLPDKDGQMYYVDQDQFYLIPTAEVPITNIFRDEIITESDLPIKRCGYTPCFRREAGSYGKEVKGLNRLHQFDKVELVQITHPDHSFEALEEMTNHAIKLLGLLELPYRKLVLCTGDMTFTSAKTYDLEVFSAGQDRWLEVSSISNLTTYQANRMKLRFRDKQKKTQLAHTLNGSALALPRIVAAFLENHQQKDGNIRIPEALRSYVGKEIL